MEHSVIPLTPLGVAQAARVIQRLPHAPSRIMVSPYLRAQQTAEPYLKTLGRHAEVNSLLQEFSALDPELLKGMSGEKRRPIAVAYWNAADPEARWGPNADTFREFDERVTAFIAQLPQLPDRCVLFGHGIWFSLLWWKLRGFGVQDSPAMKAFRRSQRDLPMPNCAVYELRRIADEEGDWTLTADNAPT
jgi:broad specificity phosphatase PhoE